MLPALYIRERPCLYHCDHDRIPDRRDHNRRDLHGHNFFCFMDIMEGWPGVAVNDDQAWHEAPPRAVSTHEFLFRRDGELISGAGECSLDLRCLFGRQPRNARGPYCVIVGAVAAARIVTSGTREFAS